MVISTTLVGRGCEAIVAEALLSVGAWVDGFLLIDTGDDAAAMEAARRAAGDRALLARFPWIDDYAAARNFALDEATRVGARWAVTLDPDERIQVDPSVIRNVLATTSAGCILLPEQSGRYAKERFFRLPSPERFAGIVHEGFPAYRVGAETLERGSFRELEKPALDLRRKSEREVEMLRRQIALAPHEPRWRYYLGDSLERVGDRRAAIDAYATCVGMRGWPEEAAWACYRAAQCELEMGEYAAAVDWCGVGLSRHPGMPELAWTAALAEWRAGNPSNAISWARIAESLGDFAGCAASSGRIGFRHVPAAYEGPYDVMRFAFRDLGDERAAAKAEDLYEAAKARRLSGGGAPLEDRQLTRP